MLALIRVCTCVLLCISVNYYNIIKFMVQTAVSCYRSASIRRSNGVFRVRPIQLVPNCKTWSQRHCLRRRRPASTKNVRAREPHTGRGTLSLSMQVHPMCIPAYTGRYGYYIRAHGWIRCTGSLYNALGQARSSVALPHVRGCMHTYISPYTTNVHTYTV